MTTLEELVKWLEEHGVKDADEPCCFAEQNESASDLFERKCNERGMKVKYVDKTGTNSVSSSLKPKKK